jgi:hypothetical protein
MSVEREGRGDRLLVHTQMDLPVRPGPCIPTHSQRKGRRVGVRYVVWLTHLFSPSGEGVRGACANDMYWHACDQKLMGPWVHVFTLPLTGVRIDSTPASRSADVHEQGLIGPLQRSSSGSVSPYAHACRPGPARDTSGESGEHADVAYHRLCA